MSADGRCVPTLRTQASFTDFVDAAETAMRRVWGEASDNAVAMFWSKYMHETGGKNCWCWNTGNVKKFDGDGHDWCYLNGVWECYPVAEAERLIASGEAKHSTIAWQKCGDGRTAVVFEPPHKQCRFRAFETLDRALYEHMNLILLRYAPVWPAAVDGDCGRFVRALKSGGYFTGDERAYVAGVQTHFAPALALLSVIEPPPDAA